MNGNEGMAISQIEPSEIRTSSSADIKKKRAEQTESPPSWTESLPLEGLNQVQSTIKQLQAKKAILDSRLALEEKKGAEIRDHYRLLYAAGEQLEDAIFKALRLLEFEEVEHFAERDGPLFVFKFQTLGRYEYGLIGVSGSEDRISTNNITKCSRWTDQYFEMKKRASKAILIANEFRLEEYPSSIENRKSFDFNELEYARMKDIVILPSYVIFEAVRDYFKDNKKSRAYLEEKIGYGAGLVDHL